MLVTNIGVSESGKTARLVVTPSSLVKKKNQIYQKNYTQNFLDHTPPMP
jgi:hypothetical protein